VFLYETHMHTSPVSACASGSPSEQVRAYKDKGYSGIIVTDHFLNGNSGCPEIYSWEKKMDFFIMGYSKAKQEGDALGLDVFFGWEFNVDGAEFLTYGLTPDFLREQPHIDLLTVPRYSRLVRKHGGYLAQAHPYRNAWWINKPGPVEAHLIDGIEIYNGGSDGRAINQKALAFARQNGLPVQAGSDSHHPAHPHMSGVALSKKAETVFDVIEAIRAGQAELILPDSVFTP